MNGAGGEGAFEAATGDGPPAGERADPARAAEVRAAEVRTAFAGLLQIRRLTGASPALWERRLPVRAVALALEAGGVPPSAVDAEGERVATGYRVSAGDRPETVRVEWAGPPGSGAGWSEDEGLADCARVLRAAGWEALLYRGPRRRRFLEVEPPAPAGDA